MPNVLFLSPRNWGTQGVSEGRKDREAEGKFASDAWMQYRCTQPTQRIFTPLFSGHDVLLLSRRRTEWTVKVKTANWDVVGFARSP
ncbi:hypothetical protein Poly41_12490 [Novipirellula artificiosorum]|uniref:Uncharacterized protein n=1 Tax=Novipirellula artificiosorum TaxID=2528016 RepID=A0A5C6DWZ3_9BACT|nr:hypothetical protein Poly41_12490 [Novipirellula artificiosorum]